MRDKFPGFTGKVDRWQIIHYEAPSTICIDVRGIPKAGTGAPEGDRSQGVNGYVMNTISPETGTSHYFWSFQRNSSTVNSRTQLRNSVHGVFGGSKAMLIAQQEAIDANPDYSSTASTSMPAACGCGASSNTPSRQKVGMRSPALSSPTMVLVRPTSSRSPAADPIAVR